jgi:hypothetical protein
MSAFNTCVGQVVPKAKIHGSWMITSVTPPVWMREELDREAFCAQTKNDSSMNDPDEKSCVGECKRSGAQQLFVRSSATVLTSGCSSTRDNILDLSIPLMLGIGNMRKYYDESSQPMRKGPRFYLSSTDTGTLRRHRRETSCQRKRRPASSTYTSCSFLSLRRQQSSCAYWLDN